jgi:hypothetical protein
LDRRVVREDGARGRGSRRTLWLVTDAIRETDTWPGRRLGGGNIGRAGEMWRQLAEHLIVKRWRRRGVGAD